ncbi:MAG: acyl-CoA dehydrogenase family protein, partial [Desulfobacula sp.]|nr:acyl-CoA dehydrogenase family protein [Desulfobacula sp.]
MDFDLTKEQEMIRKEVRKFAQKEIAPIAGELDEKEEFSAELTQKMGEIGLFGMFVSEKYDGQEMDYISYIIGVEEIARIDGSQAATIAAGNSLGIGPIYYFGTEEQKQKYLPKLQTKSEVTIRHFTASITGHFPAFHIDFLRVKRYLGYSTIGLYSYPFRL